MKRREPPRLTRWRWVGKVLQRYDPVKRPRLTAWIGASIVGLILLFGVLGYLVPSVLVRAVPPAPVDTDGPTLVRAR